MARYVEIHPVDPQQRLVDKVAEHVRNGEVIAFPTDSGYAIGCSLANKEGLDGSGRFGRSETATTSPSCAMTSRNWASSSSSGTRSSGSSSPSRRGRTRSS